MDKVCWLHDFTQLLVTTTTCTWSLFSALMGQYPCSNKCHWVLQQESIEDEFQGAPSDNGKNYCFYYNSIHKKHNDTLYDHFGI